MKNIKKIALGMALTCMIALCPILCLACGEDKSNDEDNYGANIAKAVSSSISVLKSYNSPNQSQMNLYSLELKDTDNVLGNIFILDYIKAIAESQQFEYTTSPFKGTATVSQSGASMTILSSNKFSIEGNNVSVEMYFTNDISPDYIDYEWMEIDYNFETDQLNSFKWYEYASSGQGIEPFFYYEYQGETIKVAVENDSDEYVNLKNSIKEKSSQLAQSQEFVQKVYDFTQEYGKVLDLYNTTSYNY